jgi:hypothetical protein
MVGHRKTCLPLIGICLLVVAAAPAAQEGLLVGRSTSASGQFVIYSKDAIRRTMIAQRADEVRVRWLKKIGSNGDLREPIIIQELIGAPRPRDAANVQTRVFEGDGGVMKVQTDIFDASVLRGQILDAELYRALGLSWIYRNRPPKAGKAFHGPPDWMIEGLVEEQRVKENGPQGGIYATLLQSDRPPRIEEFLKTKPELLEATSLTLYRTQALALLSVLEQLPEGPNGMVALLDSLPDRDIKALLAAYPSLQNDPTRLGKLWTLAIARSASPKSIDPYSVGETKRALQELLDISTPADPKRPDKGNITGAAALPALARTKGGSYLMRQKSAELMTLQFRAHPLLRSIVEEYYKITCLLAAKPKKNVDKQIEETGKIFDLLLQRTGQVDDYLNWFEATQLETLSENFVEVTSPAKTPKRTDPITLHLDAIEDRGW